MSVDSARWACLNILTKITRNHAVHLFSTLTDILLVSCSYNELKEVLFEVIFNLRGGTHLKIGKWMFKRGINKASLNPDFIKYVEGIKQGHDHQQARYRIENIFQHQLI